MTARSSMGGQLPKPSRPLTREEIEAAVERQCDDGRTDHEIAAALRLSKIFIRRIIAARNARTPA